MAQRRQLAAIMFTDIEGYTAAMQQSEEKALALKDRHRSVLEKEHQLYNGRVVHYFGDGSLSIFQSAVEAVACALAMQTAFRQEPVVPVRMGLHLGDVLYDSEASVFGDGVNLASRIESLGVSGSVLISDKLNDEIQNHPELRTVSVGHYRLKNVGRQVEVFALDHEGLVVPPLGSLEGKTEPNAPPAKRRKVSAAIPEKSIAVLPFVNMSNDPDQEYFSEGVAEEILTSLSNYYKVKWGYAEEFIDLWKRNHYPLLKKAREKGDILSIVAQKPRLHSSEESRWDFKVTLTFKNAALAFNPDLLTPYKAALYPNLEKLTKDEQHRFELLIAHWDVMTDTVALQ